MLVEDTLDDGLLCQRITRAWFVFTFGLIVVDVEAQDIAVFNRMCDSVEGTELLVTVRSELYTSIFVAYLQA